ncbi:MAG: XRE family transcriptional regulator [Ruminococcaceae bacterium]|nr:XRE family transcriptional regulator [Oscillospiraceae bacterium]
MLLNLKTEMYRTKTSSNKIAKAIGISKEAMSHKVTEKTQFTRDEMFAIQDKFFPETDMKYLFASDKEVRE